MVICSYCKKEQDKLIFDATVTEYGYITNDLELVFTKRDEINAMYALLCNSCKKYLRNESDDPCEFDSKKELIDYIKSLKPFKIIDKQGNTKYCDKNELVTLLNKDNKDKTFEVV